MFPPTLESPDLSNVDTAMKFSAIALLTFVSSSLAAAIERRTYAEVLYTCPVDRRETIPVTAKQMAAGYSYACIHTFKCEHSVAPILANNEWVGSCLNCPDTIPQAFDGCILVVQ
ncbi:hypothetical protein FBEOM_10725 [Fusarium beomiforme]|uniref:Uncharacterized protein n=1 Tax=Fusarium beomiforme TaxID=44412 RepID=A0A9P5ACJ7_9HYPO|nr:hypothetical protein FBEOM_10725 [Fusarium beomiforme]